MSNVAMEIRIIAEIVQPTMKIPCSHNLDGKKGINPYRLESEIYLIVLFKEGVKNLCSCVEALKVK